MQIAIHHDKDSLGLAAAEEGSRSISQAIAEKGSAAIILATGASQFATLDHLVRADIDFSRVISFHLDEYIGIADTHPASFRRYLRERFLDYVPALADFLFIEADVPDIRIEIERLNRRIGAVEIDVCFAGIGENGHLAFNDPPADFDTDVPYLDVELDEACRRQQMGEGWFATLEDVPRRAISMSVCQILKSRHIILSVPDARKANAVAAALNGPVTPDVPASILQRHPSVSLHLDEASAARLTR